jgi:hypothetical protein
MLNPPMFPFPLPFAARPASTTTTTPPNASPYQRPLLQQSVLSPRTRRTITPDQSSNNKQHPPSVQSVVVPPSFHPVPEIDETTALSFMDPLFRGIQQSSEQVEELTMWSPFSSHTKDLHFHKDAYITDNGVPNPNPYYVQQQQQQHYYTPSNNFSNTEETAAILLPPFAHFLQMSKQHQATTRIATKRTNNQVPVSYYPLTFQDEFVLVKQPQPQYQQQHPTSKVVVVPPTLDSFFEPTTPTTPMTTRPTQEEWGHLVQQPDKPQVVHRARTRTSDTYPFPPKPHTTTTTAEEEEDLLNELVQHAAYAEQPQQQSLQDEEDRLFGQSSRSAHQKTPRFVSTEQQQQHKSQHTEAIGLAAVADLLFAQPPQQRILSSEPVHRMHIKLVIPSRLATEQQQTSQVHPSQSSAASAKRKMPPPKANASSKKKIKTVHHKTPTAPTAPIPDLPVDIMETPSNTSTLLVPTSSEEQEEQGHFRDYQAVTWALRLKEATDFRLLHGHCAIPGDAANQVLARWAKRQRNNYRLLMKQGNTHKHKHKHKHKAQLLTGERVMALEHIGFVFDLRQFSWMQRFGELQEYRRCNGSCNVPCSYKPNPKLAYWVKNQRRHYRLSQQGKQTPMGPARVELLEQLGFAWECYTTTATATAATATNPHLFE